MSVMINALAGTGKTFTLTGGVQTIREKKPDKIPSDQQADIWKCMSALDQPNSICFAAFTTSAKDTIKQRLATGDMKCDVTTLSAFGYGIIRNALGKSGEPLTLLKNKTNTLIEVANNGRSIYSLNNEAPGYTAAVRRLVQLAKYNMHLEPDNCILDTLAGQYNISLGDDESRIFNTTRKVLELASQDCKQIDFDDMLWLPLIHDMPVRKYDLLIIDEGQDLNFCQQALAERISHNIVVAGDKHQAIYGFAGADTESMQHMKDRLLRLGPCIDLPLTVTRRCSHAVTELVQQLVPEFTAHYSNREGKVSYVRSLTDVGTNDLILCRTNAPLVKLGFALARKGQSVRMLGRHGLGAGLIALVKSLKANTINDFHIKLSYYKDKEVEKQKKRSNNPATIINILDRCSCLSIIAIKAVSVTGIIDTIERLFTGTANSIVLSSIHQAKGLEANRVFIIRPDLLPHPLARGKWEKEQETNLKYVAETRAIRDLTFVDETMGN